MSYLGKYTKMSIVYLFLRIIKISSGVYLIRSFDVKALKYLKKLNIRIKNTNVRESYWKTICQNFVCSKLCNSEIVVYREDEYSIMYICNTLFNEFTVKDDTYLWFHKTYVVLRVCLCYVKQPTLIVHNVKQWSHISQLT